MKLLWIIFCSALGALASSVSASPDIEVLPSSLAFGSVNIVDESATATVVIRNTGTSELVFTDAGITVADTSDFSISEGFSTAPLTAGSTRSLEIVFDPFSTGVKSANVVITTNDPDETTVTVALTGTGTAANAIVRTLLPLDFVHKVITEDPTRGREFTIRNNGSGLLKFNGAGVTITGPDAEDFVIIKMPSLEPLGNQSTNIRFGEVAFAPNSTGNKVARLTITTNDATYPEINLPLMGVGLPDRGTTVTGAYTGYGPGISTIGPGGHYMSLSDACTSLSATPLTGGDWTFQILGDLTETRNSSIAQPDTNGNHAIFCPALGVDATVTFTDTSSGIPAGHFLIGSKHQKSPNSSNVPQIPTDGIILDGTGSAGAQSRALAFRNNTSSSIWSIVVVYGDSDNTTINNCVIESHANLQQTRPAIYFSGYAGVLLLSIPPGIADNCIVEDCEIITSGLGSISSIVHDAHSMNMDFPNYLSSVPEVPGLMIRNNDFQVNGTVLSVATARHVEVSSNTINYTVPQDQPQRFFTPNIIEIGNRYSPDVAGQVRIMENRINVNGAAQSDAAFSGISILETNTSSTCLIANNMINGITAADTSPFNPKTRAAVVVMSSRESTVTVAHNSIDMPESDNLLGRSVFGVGSGNSGWPGDLVLANNIISMGVAEGHALHKYGSSGRFMSDHNDIHVTSGSNVGLWQGVTLSELADWQTSTGQDINSVSVDPFEPVSEGLGTWSRATEAGGDGQAVTDLHFTAYPGNVYLAPKIAGLETDIDSEARLENKVILGADEVPRHRARVDGWGLY